MRVAVFHSACTVISRYVCQTLPSAHGAAHEILPARPRDVNVLGTILEIDCGAKCSTTLTQPLFSSLDNYPETSSLDKVRSSAGLRDRKLQRFPQTEKL